MTGALKLSQRVICDGYIVPSKSYYVISDDRMHCFFIDGTLDPYEKLMFGTPDSDYPEVEDFHQCERYVEKTKRFSGVYVGETYRNTTLVVEYEDPPYGASGYCCRTENPKPFAIVYYALGKKRLVPMDMIQEEELKDEKRVD